MAHSSLTVADVKRDLPPVPFQIGRKVYQARLSGRLNQFATVTVSFVEHGKGYLRGLPWVDFTFAWETVASAINSGRPLRGE